MVVNSELERMWMEQLSNLRHYPAILWRDGTTSWKYSLGKPKKIWKNI